MTATGTPTPPVARRCGVRIARAVAGGGTEAGAALLRRWPRLVRSAVVDRLIDASRVQLRIDAGRSRALAATAAVIAERLGDRARLGLCYRAQANALSVSGDNRAAADLHVRALALLEAHGEEGEVARTLAASIQPLILLGEYDRARAAGDRARRLYEAQGDTLQLARLEINVGNIHQRQDRGDEALRCYERAYAALVRLGDADGMFSALHNKAVALIGLNRFREAADTYAAARELACSQQRPLCIAQADYNVAWLYYLTGDYSRAIDALHATAAFARHSGDGYHAALCLVDLSEIYLELNLFTDARHAAEEAAERFRTLGMRYERAKSIANTAIAYGQEGNIARAVELFAEARTLFRAEDNRIWVSLVDLYQALLCLNEGRLFQARRLARAAADTFAASALASKRVLCELLLARIDIGLGNPGAAWIACERLLAMSAVDADRPILRFHAYFLLGQAQAALGDRAGALASYGAARAALEALRSHIRGEELRIAFVENRLEVYERLVELLLEGDATPGASVEAFRHIEAAKSRTLLDLMLRPGSGADRAPAGESETSRSIRTLRGELSSYYYLIEREQLRPAAESPARLARFRHEVGARERELSRILREAAAADDPQSELHAPRLLTVGEIQAALPAGAVLVEFFQTRDRIVVCVIDRDIVEAAPIASAPDVVGSVRLLQLQLSKFQLAPEYLDLFRDSLLDATRAHLRALFRELLAPVWTKVRGRHLVIVPHGIMHYVPFHALLDGDDYVVDVCSVSYAPSASIYAVCERRAEVASGPSLVLGIPDERTPFIEHEVHRVAAALPGARLFVGAAATLDVVHAHGPGSRVVHIASHGYFRPDSPMFSGVRLADGFVNVHDLCRLGLPAELVTLSGCATGAGVAAPGDELLGISRGLFLAGARRLLLSLWDVADGSTADFMTHVYGLLSSGTPAVHAVSSAMREIRRERPHPYYWASFALAGKCRPL